MREIKFIILLLFFFSSCTASWHLKRAKRHIAIAEAKGSKYRQDTVFKEVEIQVPIPAMDTSTQFTIATDNALFEEAIRKYDSLIRSQSPPNTVIIYRDRFRQAFEKDTTYYFSLENNAVVALEIRNKHNFKYHLRYQQKPDVKTFVKRVPVSTETTIKPGFSIPFWWWIIAAVVALAVIFGKALISKIK